MDPGKGRSLRSLVRASLRSTLKGPSGPEPALRWNAAVATRPLAQGPKVLAYVTSDVTAELIKYSHLYIFDLALWNYLAFLHLMTDCNKKNTSGTLGTIWPLKAIYYFKIGSKSGWNQMIFLDPR